MASQVYIEGNSLRLKDDGTIIVSVAENCNKRWRWHSDIAGRYGKTFSHKTADAALHAGAAQIGLEIVAAPGEPPAQ